MKYEKNPEKKNKTWWNSKSEWPLKLYEFMIVVYVIYKEYYYNYK